MVNRVEQMQNVHTIVYNFFKTTFKKHINKNERIVLDKNIAFNFKEQINLLREKIFTYIQVTDNSIRYINFGNDLGGILKNIHLYSSILCIYYSSYSINDVITHFDESHLNEIHKLSLTLFKSKNEKYGDAFASFGVIGILVRMNDKIMRFDNLIKMVEKPDVKIDNESVIDTLMDLSNYTAMALMLLEEKR